MIWIKNRSTIHSETDRWNKRTQSNPIFQLSTEEFQSGVNIWVIAMVMRITWKFSLSTTFFIFFCSLISPPTTGWMIQLSMNWNGLSPGYLELGHWKMLFSFVFFLSIWSLLQEFSNWHSHDNLMMMSIRHTIILLLCSRIWHES